MRILSLISAVLLLLAGCVPAVRFCRQEPTTVTERTVTVKEETLTCRITVYTPYDDGGVWGYDTATGAKSEHLATCAVDPECIPLGSVLRVSNGDTVLMLKAVDTGSAVKGKHIDIFYDGSISESERWADGFGEYAEVRVIV